MIKISSLILLVIFLAGCLDLQVSPTQQIKVPDRYPDYSDAIPPKTEIAKIASSDLDSLKPAVKEAVITTVNNLKAEASALRAVLDSYQKYAKMKNEEFDAYMKQDTK